MNTRRKGKRTFYSAKGFRRFSRRYRGQDASKIMLTSKDITLGCAFPDKEKDRESGTLRKVGQPYYSPLYIAYNHP